VATTIPIDPWDSGSVGGGMAALIGRSEGDSLMDAGSAAWLERLAPGARDRDAAIAELHALLLRAARFECRRRRELLPHLRGDDLDDIAHQCAGDALVAVLAKLDDFRGESRFTTWAHKFALYETAAAMRRRSWQGRELPLADDAWRVMADCRADPGADAETRALLAAIEQAILTDLTAHQREVLVALALNDVPIDVLAERMQTTRGALYKALHDARRKLRAALAARGLEPAPTQSEAGP
jgi:RNA polymerase sigma-70 factor (ECF subfamily)